MRHRHIEIDRETLLKIQEETLDTLGQGGIISQRLPNYEFRPQQLEMAKGICNAIEYDKHLIVEAGTGIGKSLAYLIPFIIYAVRDNKKVIISTYTKTLQNQLFLKDLPFLKESLGIRFNYALCLGSENYLCLRRLNSEYTYDLFDSDSQLKDIKRIIQWSYKTKSGLISDLDFMPKDEVWDNVSRDPDLCLGKKCSYKKDCFYKKAKKKEKESDILITNHSLFFTNLASGGQVLPNFHAVVFDEAQTLEDVAASYLGFEVSNTRIKYLFDSIYNPRRNKGLLNRFRGLNARTIQNIEAYLTESREEADKFFREISRIFGQESDSKRIRTRNIVFN